MHWKIVSYPFWQLSQGLLVDQQEHNPHLNILSYYLLAHPSTLAVIVDDYDHNPNFQFMFWDITSSPTRLLWLGGDVSSWKFGVQKYSNPYESTWENIINKLAEVFKPIWKNLGCDGYDLLVSLNEGTEQLK